MLTEHALLDDNGDREGSHGAGAPRQGRQRRGGPVARDADRGAEAARTIRSCGSSTRSARELERRVEALKLLKSEHGSGASTPPNWRSR